MDENTKYVYPSSDSGKRFVKVHKIEIRPYCGFLAYVLLLFANCLKS